MNTNHLHREDEAIAPANACLRHPAVAVAQLGSEEKLPLVALHHELHRLSNEGPRTVCSCHVLSQLYMRDRISLDGIPPSSPESPDSVQKILAHRHMKSRRRGHAINSC